MDWTQKLDELNRKGYDVTDRLMFPDGGATQAYPKWWTTEQAVNKAYDYVALLERECPNLKWITK